MTAIRILTVRQPWAWAIIHGGKHVENRVRNIAGDYRGQVAIHAGLSPDTSAQGLWPIGDFIPRAGWQERGSIIGVVNLWAVHQHDGSSNFMCCPNSPDRYGRWAEANAWHLCFSLPRPLSKPIPFKGALGLRWLDEDLSDSLLKAVTS